MDQNENKGQDEIKFIDDDNKEDAIEMNKEEQETPAATSVKHDLTLNNAQNVLLPWDRFSYWAHAILVVTFDLELGQSLEVILISLLFFNLQPHCLLFRLFIPITLN